LKETHTRPHGIMCSLLKEFRLRQKLTQEELAKRLGEHQSFVSKVESGERRVDVLELRALCRALNTSLPQFVKALEAQLDEA